MKRKIIIPFAVLVLIALDQLVKLYIVSDFKLGQVKSFIPHLVSLTYLQNTGAAFSMLENQQCLLSHQAPPCFKVDAGWTDFGDCWRFGELY